MTKANENQEQIETNGEFRSKAEEMFKEFNKSEKVDHVLDSLGSLGEQAQKRAGESLEALKRPVKEMMNQDNNSLPESLGKLREIVAELDPSSLQEGKIASIFNKLFRRNSMDKYFQKYQTVESQVELIIGGLLTGKDKIQEDNLMLQELKQVAHERIAELEEQKSIGKELMGMLEEEMTAEKWRDNPLPLQKGMQKVVGRVQNMTQAVMVLQQSIQSVDLIIENNEKLEEAIFNAITMTKNIITVTASIQIALGNQKKVIGAVQNVNKATEEMLLTNAQLLRSNTEETIKTLEEPAIALESFRKAYDDVFRAIQLTEESNERIVMNGKKVIAELDEMNQQIQQRYLGMTEKKALNEG
ncbi:toxic anion resistance protein [Caldalkalibacillus mannanilyticus]|uniref:toxic anion resistance protein n=1 Tax=Caldalkalibacillus mannanilyticus TaxID=1418 RepID=UPI000468037C|nr:toxic anion resistance protein [Caldalkalibacillus mannanilyticus]